MCSGGLGGDNEKERAGENKLLLLDKNDFYHFAATIKIEIYIS